jgi:hypothetical protein
MRIFKLPIFALALTCAACGGSSDPKPVAPSSNEQNAPSNNTNNATTPTGNTTQDAANAINQLAQLGQQLQNGQNGGTGKTVDPIDFRQLKELLPATAGNLPRSDASGEKAGALGMNVSHAEGKYSDANSNSNIKVTITDTGSMQGFAMLGYGWAMTSIDRETDNGYERTTKINGSPGYEKYNNPNQTGEVSALVAGRFVVQVEGDGVNMDMIKSVLNQIDLNKLASWKDVGVTSK